MVLAKPSIHENVCPRGGLKQYPEHAVQLRLRNNIFAQYFPELDGACIRASQDDLVLSIAEHCLDPKGIAQMEFADFQKLVVSRKIGIKTEKYLREIWEGAGDSVGCPVHDEARWETESMVHELRAIREIVKESELRMEKVALQFPEYQCLLSIPGFGPIVSAMVLGAIGDPSRFENNAQILRLAGLDLCASRSGKKSDSAKPVISKQGKSALRCALVQAATVASTSNSSIRNYFSELIKGREHECGIRLKMKVKLAAKLLVIAWTLMKRREPFKPSCFIG
jgi:transposase